ncbi:DUF6475 domain-containing protein [Chromobacterium haemolyticum]|uniref:DUF6475 domain-containing protein n=1 Tax=Chromobacterium haemolyticum TaxID=394935 RepID=A0A1W0CCW4_9NEIS|nr:DUF6475 domain-containing protein [Chromobacterium haemolyticum]OQS32579.1 hypothetical protein B0T45_21495 [Chromobacterium haemolyticum]
MTQNEYCTFVDMLQAVADLYGKRLTELSIGIYWNALKPIDLAVVREAMNRHVINPDNGQFMPKPADLVRMMEGSSQDKALQAWHKVDKVVRGIGPYSSVVFDDALIHRVLHEMGGWIALGTKTEDEWPFVAKEFENRYKAFVSRQELPEYLPVMVGLIEAENRKEGHRCEPPVLIGNAELAMSVMGAGTSQPALGMRRMTVEEASQMLVQAGEDRRSAEVLLSSGVGSVRAIKSLNRWKQVAPDSAFDGLPAVSGNIPPELVGGDPDWLR